MSDTRIHRYFHPCAGKSRFWAFLQNGTQIGKNYAYCTALVNFSFQMDI